MILTIDLNYLFNEDHTNDNSLCITYFSIAYLPLMLENLTFTQLYLGTHLYALCSGEAIE